MAAQAIIDKWCNQEVEIDESAVELFLTERKTLKTRWCDEEKETQQFLCKENNVDDKIVETDSSPLPGKEWKDAKITYTYFRC